ncbi:hypothetical protein H1R20_g4113, partial [Candolleomyces eurysporus]
MIPDLTIVLSSESVGDVGFVSFTGTELMKVKSFNITNSIAVSRYIAVDGAGDATQVSLSFAVWPRVVKAEVLHHGLPSLFKIMPAKKVPVDGRELYSAELKPAMTMGDTEIIVQPAPPLDSALGDSITIGLILKVSKLEAELVHGAENSEISRLDDLITSQITKNQDLAQDILLSTTLAVVGKAFVNIWKRTRQLQHLNQAVDNLQEGVATLSKAFATTVNLVTVVAGMEYTVKRRYDYLSKRSHRVLTAATAAISVGRFDKALEWLEQGRGLVWTQLHGLRTPLEALRSCNPQLAEAYQDVSRRLESAGVQGMMSPPERLKMSLEQRMSLNEQTAAHIKAAREHEDLLKTIRSTVPGFENFLLPRPSAAWFDHLPDSGPVVVISVHDDLCSALVLMAGTDAPLHIPLPDFSLTQAEALRDLMQTSLDAWGLRVRGDGVNESESSNDRAIKPASASRKVPIIASPIETALRQLWVNVVKPILKKLGLSKCGDARPRIWWCPTGPLTFLPLHAAGVYRGPNAEALSDYAVSSYIPTVAALAERLESPRSIPADGLGLMMVCVAGTGRSHIPGTLKEINCVNEKIKDSDIRTSRVEEKEATIKAVLEGIERCSCVHFACHGVQNAEEPLRSAFLLGDGRLELSTIIKSNLKSADLAFLSACQTSTGDPKLSEEATHLAAGMLAAGYRGVVGTMWPIQDRYAPEVADDFYKNLLAYGADGRKTIDGARAAYALDYAVKRLRDKIGVSEAALLSWLPYVHFGL